MATLSRCVYMCSIVVVIMSNILPVATEVDDLTEISSQLRQRLEDHLSENRHHDVYEVNKDNVRNYIKESLESCNLKVELQEFSSDDYQYEGVNIVGILEGEMNGTTEDNVILLGAHYDTTQTTPGIDDNGSGVALLLEAAVLVTKGLCKSRNTILFVAFDLEEYQDGPDDISIGSKHFVNEWLEPFLTVGQTARRQFQGALVMETILNYNKEDGSQKFPDEIFLISDEVHQHLESRGFRGDFLTVIGRQTDANFSAKFTSHLSTVQVADMYTEVFTLPIQGVPTPSEEFLFGNFFRSDHIRFWMKGSPFLPALFITDTANFRVPMTDCYHQSCDNRTMITDDNLLFLAKTTKAAANMLIELGTENMTHCSVGEANRIKPAYTLPGWVVVFTLLTIEIFSLE